jgi:hypothetical protein
LESFGSGKTVLNLGTDMPQLVLHRQILALIVAIGAPLTCRDCVSRFLQNESFPDDRS